MSRFPGFSSPPLPIWAAKSAARFAPCEQGRQNPRRSHRLKLPALTAKLCPRNGGVSRCLDSDSILRIIAKQQANLNFYRVERRDALRAVLAEQIARLHEVTVDALEHEKLFICDINHPVEWNFCDFERALEVARVLPHRRNCHFAHPIGTLPHRVIEWFNGNMLTSPSDDIVRVLRSSILVHNAGFRKNPPAARAVSPFGVPSENGQ